LRILGYRSRDTWIETTGLRGQSIRPAAVLAKLDPAGGIPDSGDGTGRHANKEKKRSTESNEQTETQKSNPVTSATTDDQDRAERFDKLDREKSGKLTKEIYASRQSDAEAAGTRFDKWDTNNNGFLTRDEDVLQGRSP